MFVFSVLFSAILLAHFGSPLQCYKCSGSSRNADKADKACVYGYSNVEKMECPYDHVCSTYQYEISIHGLIRSSVTTRGCEPFNNVENCDVLLDNLRSLVYPARVREINCYSCSSDLCNSSSNI
ncbi:uncharacterized protein LOC100141720 isoform X4 [Tribolium castaneum]|uniref:Protein sleepless n=1 Tax=Tribolium castaneum TaxID=7070 RepID=D6WWJ8_TRICA|nr:PREDICTED: uncharacterized protein LOC103313956 [Tribolium castaneum]EFA08720.1 hypothetical protein TcasGA2_TC006394 [Tribolium castaneum]|eukprot:XP_008196817.1 PREDICTED: uncharacterized protein LOC103313956 [Tribolium castaneum]